MNERIRELAQEVFSFKYKSNPNELNPDHNMDHIHKFAELIVRECLCKIENEAAQYAEPAWAVELVNDIKEHFGVKE